MPLLAVVLTLVIAPMALAGAGKAKTEVAAEIRALTLEQTRQHGRARQGAAPASGLQRDPAVADIALEHSRAMFRADTLAHRLDGAGPAERLARQHRTLFGLAAENVAVQKHWPAGADVARRMVEGWMNSPGHRRNILAPYEVLEVGCYGNDSVLYCTQMFVRDTSRLVTPVRFTQRTGAQLLLQLADPAAGRRQRISASPPSAQPSEPGAAVSGTRAHLPLPGPEGLYQLRLWTAEERDPSRYRIVPGPWVCVTGGDSAAACPSSRKAR